MADDQSKSDPPAKDGAEGSLEPAAASQQGGEPREDEATARADEADASASGSEEATTHAAEATGDAEAVATTTDAKATTAAKASADVKAPRAAGAPADLRARLIAGFEWLVATLASVSFAASFGFNYGVSNQLVYLLLSKKVVDPSLYTHDWLAADTVHYHRVFRYLGALLIAVDKRGWGIALGQTLAVTVAMLFVFALVRQLVRRSAALPAFLALVGVVFVSRTSSLAATYVFDEILQPSTLGSVGLLAAAYYFAKNKQLHAGLAIAFSGMFHINYLVLELGAFGIAHLLLGKKDFWPRALRLFGPPLVVFLFFLPLLLSSAGGGKEAEVAQLFYMRVRAPHHYDLKSNEAGFVAALAWLALGFGFGARVLAHKIEVRRLAAMLTGLWAVIGVGVLFASLWFVRSIAMIFAWRLMPHVEMFAALLFVCGLVESATNPGRLAKAGPIAWGSLLAGLTTIALYGNNHGRGSLAKVLFGVAGAALLLAAITRGAELASRAQWATRRAAVSRGVAVAIGLGAFALVAGQASARWPEAKQRSNLLNPDKNTIELCRWAATKTAKDAVFLTPPDNESFRFACERGIVVDWKSVPLVPKDVLAWVDRLKDVTGRRAITGRRDLSAFATLDDKRLAFLKSKYQVDYVLVRGTRKLAGRDPVFKNRAFSVFDVRDYSGEASEAPPPAAEPEGDLGAEEPGDAVE